MKVTAGFDIPSEIGRSFPGQGEKRGDNRKEPGDPLKDSGLHPEFF